MIKIGESDYAKLSATVRAGLDKYTQATSPVRVFEMPLSIWQRLQHEIRSEFPQAAFDFTGGLSTNRITLRGELEGNAHT